MGTVPTPAGDAPLRAMPETTIDRNLGRAGTVMAPRAGRCRELQATMPAPTVSFVASSTTMKAPVERRRA